MTATPGTPESFKSDFMSELESQKLLLFFELKPLSDEFGQVVFTAEQYQLLTKFVFEFLLQLKPGGGRRIVTADAPIFDFPNSQSSFPIEHQQNAEEA